MSFIGYSPTVSLIVVAFSGCWVIGIIVGLMVPGLWNVVALFPLLGSMAIILGMMGLFWWSDHKEERYRQNYIRWFWEGIEK